MISLFTLRLILVIIQSVYIMFVPLIFTNITNTVWFSIVGLVLSIVGLGVFAVLAAAPGASFPEQCMFFVQLAYVAVWIFLLRKSLREKGAK